MTSNGLRLMVAVKRVVDYAVKVRVNPAKTAVEIDNVKMAMNPFCEIATEEAVKLKEAGVASEVIAVSVGPKQSADTLRTALAMGCDRAIHVHTPARLDTGLPSISAARALAHLAQKEKVDVLLLGKQAIDDDGGVVGGFVAGKLGWGQATNASKVSVAANKVEVTREVDGGLQTVALKTPCVISTDLRLNTPRYATLPNIMKAKKKPLETKELADIEKEIGATSTSFKVVAVNEPSVRKAGVKVETVDQLVDKLRNEAKVI